MLFIDSLVIVWECQLLIMEDHLLTLHIFRMQSMQNQLNLVMCAYAPINYTMNTFF